MRKCCAPADRINSKTDYCETNLRNIPLNNVNIGEPYQLMPGGKCDKIYEKLKGPKYDIGPSSLLKIFSRSKSEISAVYRDYCLDTDTQSDHATIIFICDNFVNISKCCPLGKSFKEESGVLSCNNDNTIASANLLIPGNSNINFQISNETKFLSNQIIFCQRNFNFSEDSFLSIEEKSLEYCLEILDSKWTVINLNKPKFGKSSMISISQFCYFLIESINIICMVLVIFNLSKTVTSKEIKLCLLTFVILFVAEQVSLMTSYFVDLREIIVIKNSLTICYFCILNFVWISTNAFDDSNEDELSTNSKIYLFSACLIISIVIFEAVFFLICFLKNSIGEY